MSKILYHYCSSEVFFEIISKSKLWFGNIEFMNDSMEGKWLPHVISKCCDKYTTSWEDNEKTREIKSFIKNDMMGIFNKFKDDKDRYILCLSENPDLLSQWRGYGDDGRGISLGIDVEKLIDSKTYFKYKDDNKKYVFNLEYPNSDSGKVIYLSDNEEDNLHIKNIFNKIKDYINKCSNIKDIKLLILVDLMDSFNFKNSYFSEENEHRIGCFFKFNDKAFSYSEVLGEYKADIKVEGPIYNHQNNMIKDHLEIDFSKIKENIIREIYLGPKCKLNIDLIKKILKINGYKNVDEIKIIESKGKKIYV